MNRKRNNIVAAMRAARKIAKRSSSRGYLTARRLYCLETQVALEVLAVLQKQGWRHSVNNSDCWLPPAALS